MKIGLIGKGFVGEAIYQNLKKQFKFLIYDIDENKKNVDHIRDVTHGAEVIFVALPTPMQEDGKCDLSIIFDCFNEISYWYKNNIIILKSTVLPGTSEKIKSIHPELKIVFSPEFLTEANFVEDFKNSNRVILGGEIEDTMFCAQMFQKVFPNKNYLFTNHKTAETVKYFINNFLATKVSFANEMKEICDSIDIEYEKVKDLALYDKRLGASHFLVPGPDGELGFGGTCFPKDINAMIWFAKSLGVNPEVLTAVWNKNLKVRKNLDWLSMEGRAISKKEKK
jgi:nucleotide sugar dehydrogenase